MIKKRATLRGWPEKKMEVHTYYRMPSAASSRLFSLSQYPGPCRKLVVVVRVSKGTEIDDLPGQELYARQEYERLGFTVVAVVPEVMSGKRHRRPCLSYAFRLALALGAQVGFKDLDRFIRHPKWNRQENRNLKASPAHVQNCLRYYPRRDVILLLPPDATDREIRRARTKQGHLTTGHKGGGDHMPGYKKRLKQKKLDVVLELRQMGFGYGTIAKWTSLSKPTVQTWIENAKSGV